MAKRLTDAQCRKARRPGIAWDAAATGLGFKVLPSGKKLFVMQLRWPGRGMQTVKNLGPYGDKPPALTLAAARERAGQFYALAKAGVDPFEAEEEQRRQVEAAKRAEAARKQNTFAGLAERYSPGAPATAGPGRTRRRFEGSWSRSGASGRSTRSRPAMSGN